MHPQIAPWLSVSDATRAVAFYQAAFGAIVHDRMEGAPGTVEVAQLSIGAATVWVQRDPAALGASSMRLILTVDDPDAVFAQALRAGGTEVSPVAEGHGWRVGRLADPSGHHWEIGRPLSS